MDNFEVPSIPAIYVSHKTPNVKQNVATNQNANSESQKTAKQELNGLSSEESTQLCSSCSHVLLKYLEPLQQYVNEVVEIARGQQTTSQPLIALPNHTNAMSHSNSSQPDLNQTNKVFASNEQSDNKQRKFSPSSSDRRHSQSSDNRQQYSHSSDSQLYVSNDGNYRDLRQTDNNESYQNNEQIITSQNFNSNDNLNNSANSQQNQLSNADKQELNELESRVEFSQQNQDSEVSSKNDNKSANTNTNIGINEKSIDKSVNVTQFSPTSDETHDLRIISDENANQLVSDGNKANEVNNESEMSRHQQQQTFTNTSTQQYSQQHQSDNNEQSVLARFAFVTTAYNNLSAANAIILANSLLLTNNKNMNYIDEFGNKNIIQIHFVILLGGNIEPSLKDAIYHVFDEVISQPMDIKLALLSDQSFGIQQFKIQLWKELINYNKCVYLESATMVIGKVTNLFQECDELSACVDWLFPDYFNCSVFVFEPNINTYNDIINFALLDQKIKSSSQRDDSLSETLDEMTLLNKFFASKWKRISFIYNFVRNDAIYTQMPAFMRFGDTIKIVNFGHMHMSHVNLGNQSNMSSLQPWHIMVDLLTSAQTDAITSASIDNYSKFYLNIFLKRLWPILQANLTPLLISKYGVGRREWSIFELIRVLSNQSGLETDDHMFTQNPITLRRIKSATENLDQLHIQDNISTNEFDNKSVEDVFNVIEDEVDVYQTSDTELESELEVTDKPTEPIISPQELDERSMREFEAGRIDWMGAHKSDKIIQRLKNIIK